MNVQINHCTITGMVWTLTPPKQLFYGMPTSGLDVATQVRVVRE